MQLFLEAAARGRQKGTLLPLPDFSADQIGEAPGRASEPGHMEPIAFVACSKVHILISPLDYVNPDVFYSVIRIFLSG